MKVRRRLRLLAVGLVSTLALGACGLLPGDDEPAGTAAAPAPVSQPFELAGVCPNPVVIQTDWYPESEYGASYNLVGDGYRVDTKRKLVRGPMVVDGKATGVDVEVRSGGPAIDFARISEQMYADRDITLGFVNTEQAAQLYPKSPTLSVAAPMDISPGAIMWSPDQHPDWNTMVDIGQDDDGQGAGHRRRPVPPVPGGDGHPPGQPARRQLRRQPEQVPRLQRHHRPGRLRHRRAVRVRRGDHRLGQAGQLPAGPRHRVRGLHPDHVDPERRQGPAGPLPAQARPGDPALDRRVRHQAGGDQRPDRQAGHGRTTTTIWQYSPELAKFSVTQQLDLGIVGNGPDQTIGNFDLVRVDGVLDIVRTIFAGRRQPLKEGLRAEDLATNEFIDPSISLPSAAS